ncbi:MAG: RNA pseudouridine synthase [Bacteroidota bacterium]
MEKAQIGDWLIYKNNQLIAFNKPNGMLTQGDQGEEKSLLDLAEIYSKSKLHLLHRLDRPASGIVLLAKTNRAIRSLSQQFQDRNVQKTYLAIVKNTPPKGKDTLTHYLKRHAKSRKSLVVSKEDEEAQEAILTYEVIGKSDNYNLLKINLQTGRFHQIRAQLAAINCPIKGDVKYGARRKNTDRSIHLHAWQLQFQHPVSDEAVQLTAAVPTDNLWQAFREGWE